MSVVSFDLWGTLIKASPTFSEKKMDLVIKYFPQIEYYPGTQGNWAKKLKIGNAFKETKDLLNDMVEMTGFQPSHDFSIRLLLSNVNGGYVETHRIDDFHKAYQIMAIDNPPEIYSKDTIMYLKKIKEDGHTLQLTSNTMLIDGNTLSKIMDNIGLDMFDLKVFSSDVGFSKPLKMIYGSADYHFGDNPITDYHGAIAAGCKAMVINSNEKTIKDAYEYITN